VTSLPRAAGAERMDAPEVDPRQLAHALDDLRRVNRFLGGTRVVLRHLGPMLRRLASPGRPVRVLDIATGAADIPLEITAWARRRGIAVRVTATDAHPVTVEAARARTAHDPDVVVETADALALPYADGAFDIALCSTALHHFDHAREVETVLREMRRVAAHGLIVNDLRRGHLALAGARLLAATVWRRHTLTRHDGPLSVRRAFTPRELAEHARAAGLTGARVFAHVPFRVALVADGSGSGDGGAHP
jgi:2-polyprenyl-3-methyl-5-hydroxy-6-metoxy-1,4-benzoquinol methylase